MWHSFGSRELYMWLYSCHVTSEFENHLEKCISKLHKLGFKLRNFWGNLFTLSSSLLPIFFLWNFLPILHPSSPSLHLYPLITSFPFLRSIQIVFEGFKVAEWRAVCLPDSYFCACSSPRFSTDYRRKEQWKYNTNKGTFSGYITTFLPHKTIMHATTSSRYLST